MPSVPAAPRAIGSANTSKTTTTTTSTTAPSSSGSSHASGTTTATAKSTATAVTASTTASSTSSTPAPILASKNSSSSSPPPPPRSDDGAGGDESPTTSAATSTATSTNNGPAYERKKQRAKTARIKLNESIDRLSIAINLAGTQSKERAEQWEARQQQQMQEEHPSDDPAAATSTTTTTSNNNACPVARIIRDCVKTAEDAKKWDRPSFVGSAASLIQGMNAQCEALMRQVSSLQAELQEQQAERQQQQHKHGLGDYDDLLLGGDDAKRRRLMNGHSSSSNHASSLFPPPNHGQGDGSGDSNTTTVAAATTTPADRLVFAERTVMDRVASFLEPLSVVRCMRVSKAWHDWGVFSNEPLWQHLAVERFGYFNVRQWRGLLEEHHHPYGGGAVATGGVSTKTLYQKMDAANVMPHFRHDGMLRLGEARLPGTVSAWTFLVERSNGETMRSVRRPPVGGGANASGHRSGCGSSSGQYTSSPVVQLWTVIQNTGVPDEAVVLREQTQTVDASTRRRGEELKEIDWDERFCKRILNLDGSVHQPSKGTTTTTNGGFGGSKELCRLKLFDAVILESNIHALGCSTTSKFVQRSNYTKVLVQIRHGTTVPLVIPFPRDASHLPF